MKRMPLNHQREPLQATSNPSPAARASLASTFSIRPLLLLLAVLWLPSSAPGGPLLDRFFPLCNGDAKTFSSPAGDVSVTVASANYRGQAAFELRIQSGGGATAVDQRRYFRISGDDLLYIGARFSSSEGSFEAAFNPPILLLSETLLAGGGPSAGTTSARLYGTGLPSAGYPVHVEYTYNIGLSGALSVPACGYGESRSVDGRFTLTDPADPDDPELLDFPEFLYLVPGVGLAQMRVTTASRSVTDGC
jgi:hypothetical protein